MKPQAEIDALPKISIVIATLNCAQCLGKCLESIISQTYSNKEIVLIDGVSSDGTLDLIQKYNRNIAYWESSPDTGIYQAWNKSLHHVSGEWLVFLGADDFFYSNDVLSQMAVHLNNLQSMSLVYGCALLENEKDIKNRIGSLWRWKTFVRRMTNIPHTAAFHNAKYFFEHGVFDESFKIAGDYELLLRCGKDLKVAFIDQLVVCIGINGVSKRLIVPSLKEARRAQIKNKAGPTWKIWMWYWWYRTQVMLRSFS